MDSLLPFLQGLAPLQHVGLSRRTAAHRPKQSGPEAYPHFQPVAAPLTSDLPAHKLKSFPEKSPDEPTLDRQPMKTNFAILTLALCLACTAARANAQSSGQKCPVVLDHIALSYNHEGGQSKPQLRVKFDNAAGKRITKVTFSLSVLESSGYPQPYPEDLVYRDGLEAGKQKIFAWSLAPESIDIHHAGETVLVLEVEFADATRWKDDGSESCVLTVDFHPR